jgi:hypothetical protein
MNYQEAWLELYRKLDCAKTALNYLKDRTTTIIEQTRIKNKIEGVDLALQYMYDIKRSMDE